MYSYNIHILLFNSKSLVEPDKIVSISLLDTSSFDKIIRFEINKCFIIMPGTKFQFQHWEYLPAARASTDLGSMNLSEHKVHKSTRQWHNHALTLLCSDSFLRRGSSGTPRCPPPPWAPPPSSEPPNMVEQPEGVSSPPRVSMWVRLLLRPCERSNKRNY